MSLPFDPKRVRAYEFELGRAGIGSAATCASMMARFCSFMIPKLQPKSTNSSRASGRHRGLIV